MLTQCERHGLHYDPSLAAGCVLCRREPYGLGAPAAPRFLRVVLLALALGSGGLLSLWLKNRPNVQSARGREVIAIRPIQANPALRDGTNQGATAASTVWVNSTERAANPAATAPVIDDYTEGRVTVNTNTEEYTISGDTADELVRSMDRAGPMDQPIGRRSGHTQWHVDYHYRYERSAQGCRTRPVSTQVNISYEMPHWATETNARPSLQTEWDRYLAALWVHEQGHGDHGIQAANDIKAELEALPPEADCEAAGARANAVAHEIRERYAQIDVDYDRQTKGGKTQGARFENR